MAKADEILESSFPELQLTRQKCLEIMKKINIEKEQHFQRLPKPGTSFKTFQKWLKYDQQLTDEYVFYAEKLDTLSDV